MKNLYRGELEQTAEQRNELAKKLEELQAYTKQAVSDGLSYKSELSASQAREAELRADLSKVRHALNAGMRETSELKRKLEAAESRILASQEQEPVGVVAFSAFGSVRWTQQGSRLKLGTKLYAQPVILREEKAREAK